MRNARGLAYVVLLPILCVAAFSPPPALSRFSTPIELPDRSAPAIQSSASPLADAVAKTLAATVFEVRQALSGDALMMPGPTESMSQTVTVLQTKAEFSGKDLHAVLNGLFASVFVDDPNRAFEMFGVGVDLYIHGPAAAFDAPEDKWYRLGTDERSSIKFNPFADLTKIASASDDWARFELVRKDDSVDGQKCDLYSSGTDVAEKVYAGLAGDLIPSARAPVFDSGIVSAHVCADGYLHRLTASFEGHTAASPDKKGKAEYNFEIFNFDGNIVITAPEGAIAPSATATPAVQATRPAAPFVTPDPSIGYNGDWEGTTSSDTSISFSVEENQITFVNLSYYARVGDCSLSGSLSTTPPRTQITDNSVMLQMADSWGKQYVFSATFTTPGQANGTLQVNGQTDNCGTFDTQSRWTASWLAPEPTPTAAVATPTPTTQPVSLVNAGGTVRAFFEALNVGKVDAALSLLSDDVVVQWGVETFGDKDELESFLADQSGKGITFQVSDVRAVGDVVVNFAVKESGGSRSYSQCTAIIDEGLIDILTIR